MLAVGVSLRLGWSVGGVGRACARCLVHLPLSSFRPHGKGHGGAFSLPLQTRQNDGMCGSTLGEMCLRAMDRQAERGPHPGSLASAFQPLEVARPGRLARATLSTFSKKQGHILPRLECETRSRLSRPGWRRTRSEKTTARLTRVSLPILPFAHLPLDDAPPSSSTRSS